MSTSSEEKSEKEKSTLDIVKNWFFNSPSHGIRRIISANSVPARLFWSSTFLVFTTFMCFFIYTVVMKFVAYPTKINLSVQQYRDPEYFPAITFCNLNPLRSDQFLDKDRKCFPSATNPRPYSSNSECRDKFTGYMNTLLEKDVNNRKSTFIESGYTLNDLLIKCTFNGQSCHRNFTSFFHPNYGNCYTFDNDIHVDRKQKREMSHSWSIDDEHVENGYTLFLELFLYEDEYISYLDDRAAFRIFIHRKNEIPILSQNSLFLAPTKFTKLTFSQRIIAFSQQCRNDLTDDMKEVFPSSQVRYSQALCFKLCEFRYIAQHCKCTDPLSMVFTQFFAKNQTTKKNNKTLCLNPMQCLKARKDFNSKKPCPQCLPECELIQYTIQSSYADYPNTRSANNVLKRVEKHLNGTRKSATPSNTSACSNTRKTSLLDDIVAVEISASPYATEILAESPMYTWVDLISSIGGQTGLWIGVSLISFIEIAELLFLLICHFIKLIYQILLNQCKNFYQRFCQTTIIRTKI